MCISLAVLRETEDSGRSPPIVTVLLFYVQNIVVHVSG